jgi:hypothetical protein
MIKASTYQSHNRIVVHERIEDMTMIHYLPVTNRSSLRPSPSGWLDRLSSHLSARYAEWRRERMLRALEALPPETLKDIGWPTTDTTRIHAVRK